MSIQTIISLMKMVTYFKGEIMSNTIQRLFLPQVREKLLDVAIDVACLLDGEPNNKQLISIQSRLDNLINLTEGTND